MGSEEHPLLQAASEDSPFRRLESKQSERNWVVHIKSCLEGAKCKADLHPPSIFMVSSPLRSVKHEHFVPQVVAIGPYHSELGPHHSSFPENQETERYKVIAAQEMKKHKIMASKYVEQSLKSRDFCSLARSEFLRLVPQARDEYDTELVSCQVDEKLAYMLALDAAFIVEVLRSNAGLKGRFHEYYCSQFPRPLRKSILLDFVLLENQIPLFLLLKIMQQDEGCASDERAEDALGLLIVKIAHEILPLCSLSEESVHFSVGRVSKRKHLLDCLYAIVTHAGMPFSTELPAAGFADHSLEEKPTHFPRAVELVNCGITIKALEKGNMMSIDYNAKKATLYMPKLRVGDDTERLLRNLIAYESHHTDEVHVLSYLRFMNGLIDGPDDVELLVEKGVVVQDIGSNEEVALVWNRMCVNTMRVCSLELEGVAQQLLQHCRHRRNVLKAEFKREYLSRPWLTVSVLSAAALLIMTLLIVIYTILLYQKEGS